MKRYKTKGRSIDMFALDVFGHTNLPWYERVALRRIWIEDGGNPAEFDAWVWPDTGNLPEVLQGRQEATPQGFDWEKYPF